MDDKLGSFSSEHDAQIAAQRIMIAALTGGYVKTGGYSTDAEGAKELGSFLGGATAALAKALLEK